MGQRRLNTPAEGEARNLLPRRRQIPMDIPKERLVAKTARIFLNNGSQAVRLPKEFQFATRDVYIRKEGEEVILSPRPAEWSAYLDQAPKASAEFMSNVEELPVQERGS